MAQNSFSVSGVVIAARLCLQ